LIIKLIKSHANIKYSWHIAKQMPIAGWAGYFLYLYHKSYMKIHEIKVYQEFDAPIGYSLGRLLMTMSILAR
jgi:hypothetical protein